MIKLNDEYYLVKDQKTPAFHLFHAACANSIYTNARPSPGYVTSLMPNNKQEMWTNCVNCGQDAPRETFNKAHFIVDS